MQTSGDDWDERFFGESYLGGLFIGMFMCESQFLSSVS